MATTIQIKRGTSSAVPSGLADGELAINLDNGKLYFGSGSTSVNSFRFTNLTADNYIVSSSVTSYTFQTLSGSSDFGDDVADIHKRTGSLNVSGSVTVDGALTATDVVITDDLTLTDDVNINATGKIYLNGAGGTQFITSPTTGILELEASSKVYVDTNLHITSDISSSGTITAATRGAAAVSDTLAAAIVAEIDNDEIPIAKLAEDAVTVTAGTGLTGGGSITLGGSATVNVIGGTGVTANANDIAIGQDVATTTGEVALNTTDSATTGQVFADTQITKIKIGKAGSITSTLLESNVTASGDISASGTITAATLDAAAVSDTLAAAIVAEIDNDEIPIAKLAEDAVTVTAGTNLGGGGSVTLGGSITLNVDDAFIKNDADDATTGILTVAGLKSTTHITSSGNISASGNMIANGLF
jgi:hypothetical protein